MRDEAMVQRLSRAYMRSSIVEQLGLGLALMALPLATGCLDEGGLSLESTAAAAPSSCETVPGGYQPTRETSVSRCARSTVEIESSWTQERRPTVASTSSGRLRRKREANC